MSITIEVTGSGTENIETSVDRKLTPTGKPTNTFVGYVRHTKLGLEKKFSDTDISHLQYRIEDQARQWVGEWQTRVKNEENIKLSESIANLLANVEHEKIKFTWDSLKRHDKYPAKKPTFRDDKPVLEECEPRPNLFDKLIKSRLEAKLVEQKKNYLKADKEWKKKKEQSDIEKEKWETVKDDFESSQNKFNEEIDELEVACKSGKSNGVEKYFGSILNQDEIPINYERRIGVEYTSDTKMLVVEYTLPDIENIPNIKEYKFVRPTTTIQEVLYSDTQIKQIYEDILYRLVLRAIHRLYSSDTSDLLESIILNGWVNAKSKSTGKLENICILSIQTGKNSFLDLDLDAVDPHDCFRNLKGVSATKLSGLAAIPPIAQINKEDKRFVQSQEIIDKLNQGINVAAMDWEEFEHLVREIFEKEYGAIGGEVKVTQSSRDLGVDAIAFDPDPIRGGKIIIQAKRYTNTVKVESVRALYGIMQDEGAMKGIMITTSDYGPDAYSFVKNKPITLLSGSNLLSMLAKHGYKAKINIREAKQLLGEL